MRKSWILLLLAASLRAQQDPRDLARSILAELIGINTTDSVGDNTAAAEAMAKRLRDAGFPPGDVEVVVPAPKKGNVVVRYRGAGKARPVLFLSHLDVVEARREDWTLDPFHLTEKDGYFYGRGTQDIKGDASLLVANFVRLKREGFQPDRDLILALTADEEGGRGPNGVQWLLDHRRSLIDAEFCINTDAGGGQAKNGKRQFYTVQAAEKGYVSFYLKAKNPGGHSSLPTADNAIYELSTALLKVRDLKFPIELNEITRGYFTRTGVFHGEPDQAQLDKLAGAVYENALLRTTCVATMLTGGHADNALPQSAEATVNCRVLPGGTEQDVRKRLQDAVGSGIEIRTKIALAPNPASPLVPSLMDRVETLVGVRWPGLKVVPVMETGGTDAKPLRGVGIPTYGISQMFYDMDDIRAHGQDERIRVEYFYDGLDFGNRLIREMSRVR